MTHKIILHIIKKLYYTKYVEIFSFYYRMIMMIIVKLKIVLVCYYIYIFIIHIILYFIDKVFGFYFRNHNITTLKYIILGLDMMFLITVTFSRLVFK